MHDLEPQVPENLHALARELLESLRARPEAGAIVLGGGVALQHYCEYRETVDLDAWWHGGAQAAAEALLGEVMTCVARRHGLDTARRAWRETVSYELQREDRKVFSFQIAERAVELDRPLPSAWPPVLIESFRDNLGAKMNALVERGAPRDFLDVCEVCRRGLAAASDCWDLWAQKNPGHGRDEGRLRVLHHLELLETRRPLESIVDAGERRSAHAVRRWVRGSLCGRPA
jgi:hypothetical protein